MDFEELWLGKSIKRNWHTLTAYSKHVLLNQAQNATRATHFWLLIPVRWRHICKTCSTIEMFLNSQYNVIHWPEGDGCYELHHNKKQYSQQNISLPRSIVWKTWCINLCWWLEVYNTELEILAFPSETWIHGEWLRCCQFNQRMTRRYRGNMDYLEESVT